jgi:lipopolysaccharide export system protein LptC
VRLADGGPQGFDMKGWSRALKYAAAIAVIAVAYFISRGGSDDNGTDAASATTPDPGYAARDAQVIETGYDGRERYRLNARVIRQRTESGLIELEQLTMDYHAGSQDRLPGESAPAVKVSADVWHLTSDRGEVRANGDDVQLNGNVRVTGPAPGSGEPLSLTTETMRINTPTEFIETSAPVKLRWSGHELDARGMQADLKAGTLRLESDVNGHFYPK